LSADRTQNTDGDQITLERGACFCQFTLTIKSDGSVTFDGRRFTKTTGTATGKISQSDFRALVAEFVNIYYFSLPDAYTPGTKECPRVITDMPSANTSIRLNGRAKSVAHYYDCGTEGAREADGVETKIDEVAGTQSGLSRETEWVRSDRIRHPFAVIIVTGQTPNTQKFAAVERSRDAARILPLLTGIPEEAIPRELIDKSAAIGVFPRSAGDDLLHTPHPRIRRG
jgi:hypothetical protein